MAARLLADCSRQYCCDGARTSRIFAQEQRRRQTDETRAWRVGGSPIDAVLLPFRGQKYESPGENVRVHASHRLSELWLETPCSDIATRNVALA